MAGLDRGRPSRYKKMIIEAIFEAKAGSLNANPEEVYFDTDDVYAAFAQLGWTPPGNIWNFFKDLFRHRAEPPASLAARGYALYPAGTNAAVISRVRGNQQPWRVAFPKDLPAVTVSTEIVDPDVLRLVRADEGGVLALVERTFLLDALFQLPAGSLRRLQAPLKLQPNEVDGVFFRRAGPRLTIVAVEVKVRENLLYDQLWGIARQAAAEYAPEVASVVPLGIQLDHNGTVVCAVFDPSSETTPKPDVRSFRRFRFDPIPPKWQPRRRNSPTSI